MVRPMVDVENAMNADLIPNAVVEVGKRALRQRAAAGADRRALRAGKPRACARNGGGAQGDRRAARDRPRLQDLVRQGQPHQRRRARAASASTQALPIFAEIRDTLGVPVLTDVHETEQCARVARGRRRAADPGVPVPADRSAGRRREDRHAPSTSRRASSSRPGTWRTWSPRSPAPATATCW